MLRQDPAEKKKLDKMYKKKKGQRELGTDLASRRLIRTKVMNERRRGGLKQASCFSSGQSGATIVICATSDEGGF